jgi:predicted DNA-binding transcriptional regulator AlpA
MVTARKKSLVFPKSIDPLPSTPPVDLAASDSVLISKATMLARVEFLSFVTIWRMMQERKFPRARIVGSRVAWLKSEIDDWIASREVCAYRNDVDGVKPSDPFRHEKRRAEKKATKAKPRSSRVEA